MSRSGRPKAHSAKKLPVSIRLTAEELRQATPNADNWQGPLTAEIEACVRVGSAARARADRIGALGFELSPTDTGLELLFRANTESGALALRSLIEIWERDHMNFKDHTAPQSGVADEMPTQNWALALTEMRALVEKYDGHETTIHDSEGRVCHVDFLKKKEHLS